MIRFLGMLVVLAVLIGTFGYYCGWFHASSHDAVGQSAVIVTVDKSKFDQDKADARQSVQDLGHK